MTPPLLRRCIIGGPNGTNSQLYFGLTFVTTITAVSTTWAILWPVPQFTKSLRFSRPGQYPAL
jgi:hypothetical protein